MYQHGCKYSSHLNLSSYTIKIAQAKKKIYLRFPDENEASANFMETICEFEFTIRDYSIGFPKRINFLLTFFFLETYFSVKYMNSTPYDSKKCSDFHFQFISQGETLLLNSLSVIPQRWRIVGDDDQFRFALSQRFQRLFIAQAKFAGFHDQSQTGICAFQSFFLRVEKLPN